METYWLVSSKQWKLIGWSLLNNGNLLAGLWKPTVLAWSKPLKRIGWSLLDNGILLAGLY